MINDIKNLNKVELHLHLDGALNIDTIAKLSGKSVDDLKSEMIAPDKCSNLSEYLTKFDIQLQYMQTKENLRLVARELVKYLESQNIIYAEIRFAPMFHTRNGLSYDEIIAAILTGLRSSSKVTCNLICCAMRGFGIDDNLKIIFFALRFLI